MRANDAAPYSTKHLTLLRVIAALDGSSFYATGNDLTRCRELADLGALEPGVLGPRYFKISAKGLALLNTIGKRPTAMPTRRGRRHATDDR